MTKCRDDIKKDIEKAVVKLLPDFNYNPQYKEFRAPEYYWRQSPSEFITKIKNVNDAFKTRILVPIDINTRPGTYELKIPETIVDAYFKAYQDQKKDFLEIDKGTVNTETTAYFTPSVKIQKNIDNLEEKLVNGFLKDFGITVTEYKSMKEELGIDAYTASDFITKSIAYQEGESIIPEVAYFAFRMLGKSNNKLRSELRYLIRGWDKWNERFTYHKRKLQEHRVFYKSSKEWYGKVRDLVILDYLRETLTEYHRDPVVFEKQLDSRWTREDFPFKYKSINDLWNSIVKQIRTLLRHFSSSFNNKERMKLRNISLSIASEILDRNYEYFNFNLKEGQVQKFYKESLETDPFATEVINFIKDKVGLILTGSLVMRRAGSIYRSLDETIHDIDWIAPFNINSSPVNRPVLDKLYNIINSAKVFITDKRIFDILNKEVENFDWFKEIKAKHPSLTIINGFFGKDHKNHETYTVLSVINGEFYDSDGTHEEEISYSSKDPKSKRPVTIKEIVIKKHKKGEHIKGTGYLIDFFVRLRPYQEEHENYFALWKQITMAKLESEREKDFIDWKYFVPNLPSNNRYNFGYDAFRHFGYMSSGEVGTELSELNEPIIKPVVSAESLNKGLSEEFIIKLIDKLSSQVPGINAHFITEDEARELTKGTINPWNGQPGFFLGTEIYFVKGQLSTETAFHEFGHPIIRSIAKLNPILFNNLYTNSQNTAHGKNIKEQVIIDEPYLKEESDNFKEEVLVRSLTAAFMDNAQQKSQENAFSKFIDKLLYAIKQAIRNMFPGKKIKISKLSAETTLYDLLKMLQEDKVFDINTDLVTQEDITAYNTINRSKAVEDINKLTTDENYPVLLQKSTEIYRIINKAVETISHNPKFEDVKNLLIDEFDRGDLQEMATNMRKFTEHIKNKISKVLDKNAFRKTHAEAMLNTLFRLQVVVNKISKEIVDMKNNDQDPRTNLFTANNFDYLLKYWEKYVAQFASVLDEKSLENSELRDLVLDIKNSIETSRRNIDKFYGTGVKEILFEELKPIAKKIDDEYTALLDNLRKTGAKDSLISSWYKEYHGITPNEQSILDALNARPESSLSLDEVLQKTALTKKTFKGAKITREKFDKMFNSELSDTNIFSHFLEGYMFNPDLVVGSFALYLKNNISNVLTTFQKDANQMVKEVKPLLDRAGYTPTRSIDLISRLGYKEKLLIFDKTTAQMKDKWVWRLLNRFRGYEYDIAMLQSEVQGAELAYNRTGSEESWERLKKASMALNKHNRDWMVQEYVPEFYLKDSILEGDPIGEEASLLQQDILSQIRRVKEPLATETQLVAAAEELRRLWRKYRLLADINDINGVQKKNSYKDSSGVLHYTDQPVLPGNGKTDINNALTIAQKLTEYRSFKMKVPGTVDTMQSPFIWRERPGVFENAYIRYRQELIDAKTSPEDFEVKLEAWVKENTRVVIDESFYEAREKILKRLAEISALIEANTGQKIIIDKLYKELGNLAKPYRDDDGQPIGSEMKEERLKKMKQIQEEIIKEQKKLTKLSGLSTAESEELSFLASLPYNDMTTEQMDRRNELFDKQETMGLSENLREEFQMKIAELQQLRYHEATVYYTDVLNEQIEKFDAPSKALIRTLFGSEELTPSDCERILESEIIKKLYTSNPEFKTWFMNNHIQKERYDQDAGRLIKYWERLYAWNVVKPVDENYYKKTVLKDANGDTVETINRVPGYNFMSKQVKPEYRTGYNPITKKVKRIVGVHITNKGIDDFLPRTDVGDKYLNPDYDTMTVADKRLLEKLTEWHLKNQEGLGRRSKLWLDIPRYRMNNYEIAQLRQIRQVIKGVYGDDNSLIGTFLKYLRGLWSRLKDAPQSRFNWEDDIMLASADIFDTESTDIPITGMYDIDIDETSPDMLQGMLRYMLSAQTQKRLIAIHPVAEALKRSLPEHAPGKAANKFSLLKDATVNFITNSDKKSVRKKTIENMIDREFYGKVNTGFLGDDTIANRISQGVFGGASFAFFALNIPSALKNMFGAQFQGMIESAGGEHMTSVNFTKAWGWSMGTMSQISATVYTHDVKPLAVQIVERLDPVQDRMKMKLPTILSRTLPEDVASLSWLYNFRKWTETQASLQMFGGIMYTEKVKKGQETISYMDAWELRDGILHLKAGIDPEYDSETVKHVVQPGETIDSISSLYNITPDQLKERIGNTEIKEGNTLTVGTSKQFHLIQNKIHTVLNNLNGAYAAFDQPEAQRYLAFRFISFLRRFFTTLALNRWGVNRMTPGMGKMTEGYYTTTLKMALKLVSMHPSWLAHLAPKEKIAFMKFTTEVVGLLVFILFILPALGWDEDDPERYDKMRERSGALQIPGLTEEDPDHPFEIGGFVHNHMIALALQVQSENGTFVPFPDPVFGLDDYMAMASPKSIAFGPTLSMYYKILTLGLDQATGDPTAYYKRDVGPYKWQQEGGSKAMTSFMRSLGLTGSSLDPIMAVKNFSSVQTRGKTN